MRSADEDRKLPCFSKSLYGLVYSENTKRRALSCNFSNLSEFRFPQNIQETWQYEKSYEIKDLYIAIRQSVFRYFPILFRTFIWIGALGHKIEIWVSYCRLLSKVTPGTIILSEVGLVFPSTEMDIGGLPNLSRKCTEICQDSHPYNYNQTMK